MNTFKIILIFILAGVADLSTTLIGLSVGLFESNPHFLQFPFMATILLLVWSFLAQRLKTPDLLKQLNKEAPENFTRLQKEIFKLLLYFSFDWRGKSYGLADLYKSQWNIINYFIIGGIGVLINYAVNFSFINSLGFVISNALAIGVAMTWNWINSVGALCEYWGYTKNE
jgi:putative flippase GtrA